MHERLRRLFQMPAGVELELAVEILAAGEDVRPRQASNRQLRAVRAAADRARRRREPGPARRLERELGELWIVLQHVVHVLVLLDDLDRHAQTGNRALDGRSAIAQ